MTPTEKSRVKNAPLTSSEDRTEFVSWATSFPDGCVSAGWQPMYPSLADRRCAGSDAPIADQGALPLTEDVSGTEQGHGSLKNVVG
jgi:hypothetical protein